MENVIELTAGYVQDFAAAGSPAEDVWELARRMALLWYGLTYLHLAGVPLPENVTLECSQEHRAFVDGWLEGINARVADSVL